MYNTIYGRMPWQHAEGSLDWEPDSPNAISSGWNDAQLEMSNGSPYVCVCVYIYIYIERERDTPI